MTDALTTIELTRLSELETVIRSGFQAFMEVGLALAEIRESKLYRADYPDFDTYCRSKWNIGDKYAYRIASAAEFAQQSSIDDLGNEAQARALQSIASDLAPAEIKAVWQVLKQTAPDGRVTANHIVSVGNMVKEILITGAIDDGTGDSIPITQATLDHVKAVINEETVERMHRNIAHIAERNRWQRVYAGEFADIADFATGMPDVSGRVKIIVLQETT